MVTFLVRMAPCLPLLTSFGQTVLTGLVSHTEKWRKFLVMPKQRIFNCNEVQSSVSRRSRQDAIISLSVWLSYSCSFVRPFRACTSAMPLKVESSVQLTVIPLETEKQTRESPDQRARNARNELYQARGVLCLSC